MVAVRELSLHILDIARNSVEAGARNLALTVVEDPERDRLEIALQDDGRGMDAETLARVTDPFYTTRTTRHVGLGLPLLKATCEQAGGVMELTSTPGTGTLVRCVMKLSNVDRPPLGDLATVIQSLACESEHTELVYRHVVGDGEFRLDTMEVKRELEADCLCAPPILQWLGRHVREGLHERRSRA